MEVGEQLKVGRMEGGRGNFVVETEKGWPERTLMALPVLE